jgi:hypothetical protein
MTTPWSPLAIRRRLAGAAMFAILLALAAACGTPPATTATQQAGAAPPPAVPQIGTLAPNSTFTTTTGRTTSITALRGRPTLLWVRHHLVPSCQAGTKAVAHNLPQLKAAGVHVVELELYRDLGQLGPDITTFAHDNAGPSAQNPTWTLGTATADLSRTYDPAAYLDIYTSSTPPATSATSTAPPPPP